MQKAIARPMPRLDPVIKATWPERSKTVMSAGLARLRLIQLKMIVI
jgi:hypothetical protein